MYNYKQMYGIDLINNEKQYIFSIIYSDVIIADKNIIKEVFLRF